MRKNKLIGTVAPLSSLKSDRLGEAGSFGVGREFLKWLQKNGQGAWQFLPIHEIQLEPGSSWKHASSPYKSYGIGLDPKYLSKKYKNYLPTAKELEKFKDDNSYWLNDYVEFCLLRDHYKTDNWSKWDKENLQFPDNTTAKHVLTQLRLHKDYDDLKAQAKKKNILLLGDLPFYIGYSSPLVWANQDLFELTAAKKMTHVSGLPDGPKAHFGRQVWGHPLYLWDKKSKDIINLWKLRLKYSSRLYDMMRLDHAKGFFHYGVIDVSCKGNDRIKKGPGATALKSLLKYANNVGLQIVAEDSGDRLKELRQTLLDSRIPGLRVLRYALTIRKGERIHPTHANVNSYAKNLIAYTTTHDTETLMGYLELLSSKQKKLLAKTVGVIYRKNNKSLARTLRSAVINSPAMLSMIPIQDWLLTKDRINIPGTEKAVNDKNWQYKLNIPVEKLTPISL